MTQYTENFKKCMDKLLDNEGGYVNNPKDPGGETKFGISKRTYPTLDIKNLTRDQAIEIYWRDFWQVLCADRWKYVVAFELMDGAVNHGIPKATMLVQQAVGVADDGRVGPVTLQAIAMTDPNDLIMRYNGYRLIFMAKLEAWNTFGRGWAVRIANNLIYDSMNN